MRQRFFMDTLLVVDGMNVLLFRFCFCTKRLYCCTSTSEGVRVRDATAMKGKRTASYSEASVPSFVVRAHFMFYFEV